MKIKDLFREIKYPIQLFDENGKEIYYENSNGFWRKSEYDENGNLIFKENSGGFWIKSEYDENGNEIYFENSDGFWEKREYDENGNEVYFENSDGIVIDERPKVEMSIKEIEAKLGIKNLKVVKE